MAFTLPPLDGAQRPAFLTPAECQAWLDALPPHSPAQAQAQLVTQLQSLNRYPLSLSSRLALLDLLTVAATPIQQTTGQRFAGKPLPLGAIEQAAYDSAQSLSDELLTGYLRCLEEARTGSDDDLAMAVQRALATLVDAQQRMALARHQPPSGHWRTLHQLLSLAESRGLAERAVDLPGHQHQGTPLAAYGTALLIQAAAPQELSLRQLSWLVRWARRWGGKLRLRASPPTVMGSLPLCVALDGDQGPTVMPGKSSDARFLDTEALRQSLKQRLAQLEAGTAPKDLQLGDDCTQPATGQLLAQLYQRWCKGAMPRQQERRAAEAPCPLVCGFAAAHYQLSGRKVLKAPASTKSIEQLRREREKMATFGTSQFQAMPQAGHPEFEAESAWSLVNASPSGLRLCRPATAPGVRVAPGGLFALIPPGGQRYRLAQARWTSIESDGSLHVGLQFLPEPAEPAAVRTDAHDALQPALIVPAGATPGEPASLILPAGTFRIGRMVDIQQGGQAHACRLVRLLGRGEDYERAVWE